MPQATRKTLQVLLHADRFAYSDKRGTPAAALAREALTPVDPSTPPTDA